MHAHMRTYTCPHTDISTHIHANTWPYTHALSLPIFIEKVRIRFACLVLLASIVIGPLRVAIFFMPRLCDAAILDSYAHVVDEVLRCLIVCMEESDRDHYMFLHAALSQV